MKFISKFGNLQIVLKPGIPGEPLAGRVAQPMIYARFEGGLLETHDESMIEKLLIHPGYGLDYIKVEDGTAVAERPGLEPEHDMIDIEYGHMGGNKNPRKPVPLTKEMQGAIAKMAAEMATEMFQKLMAESKKGAKINATEVRAIQDQISEPEKTNLTESPKSPVAKNKEKAEQLANS